MQYGPVVGDEYFYIKFARSIFTKGFYTDPHYPLLYPLSLIASFLSDNRFFQFEIIKLLNAVYSSSIVIFVYLIARIYLDKRKSFFCTLISALIPYHIVSSSMVMSENIYFPLLMMAIYLVLKEFKKHRIIWDILTATILGTLYLSRYISLIVIPVFMLLWWLKPYYSESRVFVFPVRKLLRAALMGIIIFAVFSTWLIMEQTHGVSLKAAMGFSIANKTNIEQLTFSRILLWASFYSSYFVLIAAPVLGLVTMSFIHRDKHSLSTPFNRLLFLAAGLTLAFGVAVVRHSWCVAYNYPEPVKIMGRYLMYFSIIYLILGFATYVRFNKLKFRSIFTYLLFSVIIPVVLLSLSYLENAAGILSILME